MDRNDNLDLDLTPVEMPVLGGKYVLREASAEGARVWRNALLKATKFGPDGKPVSIDGIADSESLLVSVCTFTPDGKPVPLVTVRGWPNRVVKALFEKAKAISGLDEEATKEGEEDPLKNSRTATMFSST